MGHIQSYVLICLGLVLDAVNICLLIRYAMRKAKSSYIAGVPIVIYVIAILWDPSLPRRFTIFIAGALIHLAVNLLAFFIGKSKRREAKEGH